MGRLTEQPFVESCCDGGECSTIESSARACGCDPGAQWYCSVYPDCDYGREQMRSQRGEKFGPTTEGTVDEMLPIKVKRKVTAEQFNQMVENREYVGDITIVEKETPKDILIGKGGAPMRPRILPDDAKSRKNFPIASGVLDYFPDAIVAIAEISKAGNDQHNPGQPLHWDRSKSGDEADTMARHFMQRGTRDTDGKRHTAKAAWRMLAILQKEIEAEK